MPMFRYDTAESVDQEKMVKVLKEGASMGMEIDVDYAHSVTQIPRAEAGAKLLVATGSATENKADAPKPAEAALTRLAALAQVAQEADVTGLYAAKLAALSAPHEAALSQQIAAIVAESGSFDEALDKISALSNTPNQAWADAIAKAMMAANLAGRVDV